MGVGVTCTVATVLAPTVTLAEPLTPSTVAVTLAVPGPTAVAVPPVVIVTTAAFCVDHVTAWPATVAPVASRAKAVNVAEAPITSDVLAGVTTTLATEGFTAVEPPPSPPHATRRIKKA